MEQQSTASELAVNSAAENLTTDGQMSTPTRVQRFASDGRTTERAAKNKTFNVEDFKILVRKEVEAICRDEGLIYDKEADRGYAFQKWCSNLISHHEGLDDDDSIDHFTSNASR